MRHDLKQHYLIGGAAGFAGAAGALYSGVLSSFGLLELLVAYLAGVVLSYIIGWGKEHIWDASGRGTVDKLDLRRTWQGGAAGAAIPVLIFLMTH